MGGADGVAKAWALAALLVGCDDATPPVASEPDFRVVGAEPTRGVVVSGAFMRARREALVRRRPDTIMSTFFTPSDDDVARFERGLPGALRDAYPDDLGDPAVVATYVRQYHGWCDEAVDAWYRAVVPNAGSSATPHEWRCAMRARMTRVPAADWATTFWTAPSASFETFEVHLLMDADVYSVTVGP